MNTNCTVAAFITLPVVSYFWGSWAPHIVHSYVHTACVNECEIEVGELKWSKRAGGTMSKRNRKPGIICSLIWTVYRENRRNVQNEWSRWWQANERPRSHRGNLSALRISDQYVNRRPENVATTKHYISEEDNFKFVLLGSAHLKQTLLTHMLYMASSCTHAPAYFQGSVVLCVTNWRETEAHVCSTHRCDRIHKQIHSHTYHLLL